MAYNRSGDAHGRVWQYELTIKNCTMDVIDHKSVIECLSRRCSSKDADKMLKVAAGDGGDRLAIGGRICCDSRQVRADDVFVAVRGVAVDGHDFIDQALSKGAAVVVADRPVTVGGSAE